MGIVVGGLRADSGAAEEGAEAEKGTGDEEEHEAEITEEQRLGKLITLYKWRLAQFNMSDAKRGGGAKWRGLSQLMEEHKLHGIALQELRIGPVRKAPSNLFTIWVPHSTAIYFLCNCF